jgi:hypothetical protein
MTGPVEFKKMARLDAYLHIGKQKRIGITGGACLFCSTRGDPNEFATDWIGRCF